MGRRSERPFPIHVPPSRSETGDAMQYTPLFWFLLLLLAAVLVPMCAQSRILGGSPTEANPSTEPPAPAATHAAPAADPPARGENPFLQRRAGVFDTGYPDKAARDFGKLKAFLWDGFFAAD